ncbi:zinc finger protein 250-like [Scaptodrosophila lebanonensis]|uniref:Zinc finger protein 250-like n=1 Tax=Drosophila lebanonensis TaxID=7225 RepID=A0A6J2TPM4_DROLE|nr:zinc finger protein 250-like [Scaptodrosophila lebanonensis]
MYMDLDKVLNSANTCVNCGKQFIKPQHLIRHQVVHTKQKPFPCPNCTSKFSQKSSLQRHQHLKHAGRALVPTTDNAFSERTNEENAVHEVAQHALAALKQLQSGMKILATNDDIAQSEIPPPKIQETLEESRLCQFVQLKDKLNPTGKIEFITAQKIRRGPNIFYYVCEFCSKDFAKSYDLIRHRRTHTKERPYTCMCFKLFSTQAKLNEHKKRLHLASKQNACHLCIASYSRKQDLYIHLREQHNASVQAAYNEHRKVKPDSELSGLIHLLPQPQPMKQLNILGRRYKCVYCAKHFTRKFNCRSHMITHLRHLLDGEPTTNAHGNKSSGVLSRKTCEYCGKTFQKPSDLTRHLRIHKGLKAHSCSVCQKRFTLKSTLTAHMQTHQSQRPVVNCQVCGKSYSSNTALQLHLRLHTGARPFKCEVCHQTFRTSGHHIEHMRAARHKSKVGILN